VVDSAPFLSLRGYGFSTSGLFNWQWELNTRFRFFENANPWNLPKPTSKTRSLLRCELRYRCVLVVKLCPLIVEQFVTSPIKSGLSNNGMRSAGQQSNAGTKMCASRSFRGPDNVLSINIDHQKASHRAHRRRYSSEVPNRLPATNRNEVIRMD